MRDWFEKQGLSACDNTLVRSLNRLGFVYKRFSKTLPANAAALQKLGLGYNSDFCNAARKDIPIQKLNQARPSKWLILLELPQIEYELPI